MEEREINTGGQSLQQNRTQVIIFTDREIPAYGGEREVNTCSQSLQQNRTQVIISLDCFPLPQENNMKQVYK